jgi:hypothetical protein
MSRKSFAAQGLTHPRVTFEPVAGTASTWYTGTVYTNPAYDPRRADDPGDLGVVVLDRPEKLPLLLLTAPGRQSGTLACPLLGGLRRAATSIMTGSHFGREGAENARSARRDSRIPIHE